MKATSLSSPFLFISFIFLFACNNPGQAVKDQRTEQILSPAQNCIQTIIAQDDSLGAVRNLAPKSISLARTIRNYSEALQKLDFSDCPPGFTAAFEKHRQAWLLMIPFVEKYPDLRGEMHELFIQFEKGEKAEIFKPMQKSIWDTWGEVERSMKE